ncbi:hypothetical protein FMM56_01360 [Campylobacter sp. LR264d]|uniref:hypothetical protein n=1 Tax=Campylobacter sp. LR264d TaxID=2593544 RepID=UPI001238DD47|nr:hypothetical protein [Campylobacter sp. LR264d]KAA6234215.1 hypothetical protein FMM56_01360 [Campylobacter sp. LR264d]
MQKIIKIGIALIAVFLSGCLSTTTSSNPPTEYQCKDLLRLINGKNGDEAIKLVSDKDLLEQISYCKENYESKK